MEQATSVIVSKMLSADLISENEIELYNYGVQVLLEKTISYAILFGLAWILHCLLEVALFFVSFSIIRKYSGGVHCKRFVSCLFLSTAISFSGIALYPFVKNNFLLYQGGGYNVNNNCNFDWRYQQPQHRME